MCQCRASVPVCVTILVKLNLNIPSVTPALFTHGPESRVLLVVASSCKDSNFNNFQAHCQCQCQWHLTLKAKLRAVSLRGPRARGCCQWQLEVHLDCQCAVSVKLPVATASGALVLLASAPVRDPSLAVRAGRQLPSCIVTVRLCSSSAYLNLNSPEVFASLRP